VSRSWLFLAVPVALASLGLLSWTALSLLRTVRGSVIASLSIRSEQSVTINSSADLSLNIESPLLARRPTNLRFALTSADGTTIPLTALVLHVLALVFLGAAFIGSLVVSGLVLSGKSFTTQ
jgi:hypothetical protein